MNLIIRKAASLSIAKTGDWIESLNTEGSGQRWVKKVYDTLGNHARLGLKHAICKDPSLAARKYRCFVYEDKWIIAYRINGDDFIVYRFIFGPYLQ